MAYGYYAGFVQIRILYEVRFKVRGNHPRQGLSSQKITPYFYLLPFAVNFRLMNDYHL